MERSHDSVADPATEARRSSAPQANARGDSPQDTAEEYTFRLFQKAEPATRVVLDDEAFVEGALVRKRSASYYMATCISEEEKQRFAIAATSGDEVQARSRCRTWGLEQPWRVTHVKNGTSLRRHALGLSCSPLAAGGKKGRPGKKQRIALRTKHRALTKEANSIAERQAAKDEQIKEKKKRLNRLKKLRRKAKEKEKKGGGGGEAVGEASGADSEDDGTASS